MSGLITVSSIDAALGMLLVCVYYFVLWLKSGGHHNDSIVILYGPPRNLSPAMLRFIWKERFDDRTFWACILSLVSKGVATLEEENGTTFVRSTEAVHLPLDLPAEESLVARSLLNKSHKRIALNITDGKAAIASLGLSNYLHKAVIGRWFRSNYRYMLLGGGLSLAAVALTAGPRSLEQAGALVLSVLMMAPGGYYGFFVLLRVFDCFRAMRRDTLPALAGQIMALLGLLIPCLAAVGVGMTLLGSLFGLTTVVLTILLVAVNAAVLLRLRFPTANGRKLRNEIEGFREFLLSVEQLPQDRMEAPGDEAGLYEKYLPYALALEVEQSWCERLVALRSTFQEREAIPGVRPFYLGMWDGVPVEVVYKPESNHGSK